jgi:hypothetical protein
LSNKIVGKHEQWRLMRLIEVVKKRETKDFIRVPKILYKNDSTWVSPLDNDIDSIFNPLENVYYSHGQAIRWILKDDSGSLIGRVAAFIDNNTAPTWDQPTGGIGFFECINSQEAANTLFDAAVKWLSERGMEAMDGPINFGETDKYWGLLIEGFTHPSYEVAYNFPYYKTLFETYGFKIFYTMTGFHLDLKKEPEPRFMKIAEWVVNKPEYEFRHFRWDEVDKFISDFSEVFNQAWASFKKENFKPLKPEYIKRTLKKGKIVIDVELIWIAYYKDHPVAIFMMYPDINMILKHLNGKMSLINMIRFILLKRKKAITRIKGLLFGVIPEYQGRGLESGFMYQILKVLEHKPQYYEAEFSWVADYNPPMSKTFYSLGAVPAKIYATYRLLFDREKEFVRYPIPE